MSIMKNTIIGILTLALLAPVADAQAQGRRGDSTPVEVLQRWSGTMAEEALQRKAPDNLMILDTPAWESLWKAWRGKEIVPEVDFSKDMLFVFTAGGPNNVGCEPRIDGDGDVKAMAMSTLMGGPGFGYLILRIPREGVRSVNNVPLPGMTVEPRKPKAPRKPAPDGEPGFAPGSSGVVSSDASPGTPGAAASIPPIRELEGIRPEPGVFEAAGWKNPLVLKSAREAGKWFAKDDLGKLTNQVDFNSQVVLAFAWRGSGQDRLDSIVAESYPEQIFFTYKPGRTRDLREHVRLFALRSNVSWTVRESRGR